MKSQSGAVYSVGLAFRGACAFFFRGNGTRAHVLPDPSISRRARHPAAALAWLIKPRAVISVPPLAPSLGPSRPVRL